MISDHPHNRPNPFDSTFPPLTGGVLIPRDPNPLGTALLAVLLDIVLLILLKLFEFVIRPLEAVFDEDSGGDTVGKFAPATAEEAEAGREPLIGGSDVKGLRDWPTEALLVLLLTGKED